MLTRNKVSKVGTLALAALLISAAYGVSGFAQNSESPVAVIKWSWRKERIRPRPSISSVASQDELIQQSLRQQQLSAARNTNNKGSEAKLESQTTNHQKAIANAGQTELPRDGYRYQTTVRNDSLKTVASIDWDYVFVNQLNGEEVARHQFTSDEKIKPGKSKEISVLYAIPPVRTVHVGSLGAKGAGLAEAVTIERIQYSDGSTWHNR